MEKESGTVHYLHPPSYEDLVHRIEERLEKIEKEFQETNQSKLTRSELSSLIRQLETKIQKVSEDLQSGRSDMEGGHIKTALQFLSEIKRLINLDSFKTFLKSLWFRSQDSEGSYEVDEFGLDPSFIKKVKPFFDFLYYNYWRVTVKGLTHIPGEGRGLIVSNHSGTLPYDGSMIAASIINEHASRRDVRFLVEDFVYHFPFLGTFMYRTGGVRACPENAERLLLRDHLVTVFPEGVKGIGKLYKNRYRLERFGRGGFIKLALRTGSPIIPTAVIGAEEIHPLIFKSTLLARPLGIPYLPVTPTLPLLGLLGLIPLPSKWTIVFGEPFYFHKKYNTKSAEDQLLVNRLSETVRSKIQEMVVETLKHRRSVWFG